MSYKKFVDESELDLSLSNLTSININELKHLSKVTSIDLSCNLLTELPEEFCDLKQVVKLDLSKNRLQSLPSSFGNLRNLTQLDLRGNCLTSLPPSFSQLTKLRWLDLKDNPDLNSDLASASGDCLSQQECAACAKNVVQHMKKTAARLERERQQRLQAEREEEARRKQQEAEEQQMIRERRKTEKQERRRKHEEAKELSRLLEADRAKLQSQSVAEKHTEPSIKEHWTSSFLMKLLMFHVFLFSCLIIFAIVHLCLDTCFEKTRSLENPYCQFIVSHIPRSFHAQYATKKHLVLNWLRQFVA